VCLGKKAFEISDMELTQKIQSWDESHRRNRLAGMAATIGF
jgi:hypothetical protein